MTGRRPTPVADARARFAARARARRRATARPVLVLAAAATAIAALAWVLLSSTVFAVREVKVTGNQRLTTAQVLAAVGPVTGESLLRLDAAGAGARVKALPGVLQVKVKRDWPRGVQVSVVERRAIAAVRRADGWWLIDPAGVEFGPPMSAAGKLRVLTLPASGDAEAARSAAAVLQGLPAPLLRDVIRVDAPSPSGVRLHLRGGATVVWGSADRAQEKARILTTLLNRRAKVYDVSSPSVVTTR